MHSNKSNILIGIGAIIIDIVLFIVYFYHQGEHTFEFIRRIVLK